MLNKINLTSIIIAIVIIAAISWINLTYVQPYGLFGEGKEYCRELSKEGYFENKYDLADHINCTVGYKTGIDKSKEWDCLSWLGKESCFSYDYYNDSCEENIDMKDFGMRCVWGGLGWGATILTLGLWSICLMIILALILGENTNEQELEAHKGVVV